MAEKNVTFADDAFIKGIMGDRANLFDMSTTIGPVHSPTKVVVKSSLVEQSRIEVGDDGYGSKNEYLLSYFEEEVPSVKKGYTSTLPVEQQKALSLQFIKGTRNDSLVTGHRAAMPSLSLVIKEHEMDYNEPQRDRNKDWKLDSQRDILNLPNTVVENDGQQTDNTFHPHKRVDEDTPLKLGKYNKSKIYSNLPMIWSNPLQSMVRKNLLHTCSMTISDTPCIMEIFGVGMAGRIVADGVMVVEAYSPWNSLTYTLQLTFFDLRKLFLPEYPELFLPGNRNKLIATLLHFLYFEYTTTLKPSQFGTVANTPRNSASTEGNVESVDDVVLDPEQPDSVVQAKVSKSVRGSATASRRHSFVPVEPDPAPVSPPPPPTDRPAEAVKVDPDQDQSSDNNVAAVDTLVDSVSDVQLKADGEQNEAMVTTGKEADLEEACSETSNLSDDSYMSSIPSGEFEQLHVTAPPTGHKQKEKVDGFIPVPKIQITEHLARPRMPENEGYPLTIQDIIRRHTNITPKVEKLGGMLVTTVPTAPQLQQQLRVSKGRKETGPEMRQREMKLAIEAKEAEEARIKADWLAIPRRLRGLITASCKRHCARLFVCTYYRILVRPMTLSMRTHLTGECGMLVQALGLGVVASTIGASTNPRAWSKEKVKELTCEVANLTKVESYQRKNGGGYFTSYLETNRGTVDLEGLLLKSCNGWEKRVRRIMEKRDKWVDLRYQSVSGFDTPFNKCSGNEKDRIHSVLKTSALGRTSERKGTKVEIVRDDPWRDKKWGTLLCTKSFKIPGSTSHVIYTVSTTYKKIVPRRYKAPRSASQPATQPTTTRPASPVPDADPSIEAAAVEVEIDPESGKPIEPKVVEDPHWLYFSKETGRHLCEYPPCKETAPPIEEAKEEAAAENLEDADDDQFDADNPFGTAGDGEGSGIAAEPEPEEEEGSEDKNYDRNQLFHSMCPGFTLNITVYLPGPYSVSGSHQIAGSSKFLTVFDKEDLHRLLPFSNDLPLALQMCYVGFYENASKEEVSDCEKAWERIADTLMRQVRWFVRPAPPPQPAVEEPPHPKLCSKGAAVTKKEPAPVAVVSRTSSYDSDYDEPYEEPVEEEIPVVDDYAILNGLTSNLERCQAAMTFLSIDSTPCSCVRRITRGNSTHKGEWEVVLRWPATLFSKMIKMTSEAGDRPKVMMQVHLWQKADRVGIVAYDRTPVDGKCVFFLQSPTSTQHSQLDSWRFLSPLEQAVNIWMFLSLECTYYNVYDNNKVRVTSELKIVDNNAGAASDESQAHDAQDQAMAAMAASLEAAKARAHKKK